MGLRLDDATHATVQVDVSWNYDNETIVQVTRVEQKWSDAKGSWQLESEMRIGGDLGLFGEATEPVKERKDVHFPSRTIR